MEWWGGGGSLRDLSKNILKQVKAKVVRRGEGVLKVSPPLPPPENFNHTPEARVMNPNNYHFEVEKTTNGQKNGSAEESMLAPPDLTR